MFITSMNERNNLQWAKHVSMWVSDQQTVCVNESKCPSPRNPLFNLQNSCQETTCPGWSYTDITTAWAQFNGNFLEVFSISCIVLKIIIQRFITAWFCVTSPNRLLWPVWFKFPRLIFTIIYVFICCCVFFYGGPLKLGWIGHVWGSHALPAVDSDQHAGVTQDECDDFIAQVWLPPLCPYFFTQDLKQHRYTSHLIFVCTKTHTVT